MAGSIPLSQVARFRQTEGCNQISRENGKRRVVVTRMCAARHRLGGGGRAARIDGARPPARGLLADVGGQFENLAAARQRLMIVVPGCFALIFLLLVGALGSGRDALLVFSAVPLALTGGAVALWLRGMPFSVSRRSIHRPLRHSGSQPTPPDGSAPPLRKPGNTRHSS